MSTVGHSTIPGPYGKEDECAQFTIDDLSTVFTLNDIMVLGQDYTFSFWVKSEAAGSILVGGESFSTSPEWTKHATTFKATSVDLCMAFGTTDTYYIYHPQLEIGTLATDWTPAPEDVTDRFIGNEQDIEENKKQVGGANERVSTVEAMLRMLEDSVVTRVVDEDGNATILTQQGTGWVFSMSDLESSVSSALASIAALSEDQERALSAIDTLRSDVSDHGKLADYITIGEFDGRPCIELGEVGGDFKLRITNTEMYFIAGSMIRTTITNQKMIADKIEVTQEFQQGGFVSLLHGKGNLGILWKGGVT